jgi:hypothetical protein
MLALCVSWEVPPVFAPDALVRIEVRLVLPAVFTEAVFTEPLVVRVLRPFWVVLALMPRLERLNLLRVVVGLVLWSPTLSTFSSYRPAP